MTIHDMASVFFTSYLKTESENQNSGFNIFLVSTHSACPYKKLWPEVVPEVSNITLFKSFFFSTLFIFI